MMCTWFNIVLQRSHQQLSRQFIATWIGPWSKVLPVLVLRLLQNIGLRLHVDLTLHQLLNVWVNRDHDWANHHIAAWVLDQEQKTRFLAIAHILLDDLIGCVWALQLIQISLVDHAWTLTLESLISQNRGISHTIRPCWTLAADLLPL